MRVRFDNFYHFFFLKQPMEMKSFRLIIGTKLFHFHSIFRNGGGGGVQENPCALSGSATAPLVIFQGGGGVRTPCPFLWIRPSGKLVPLLFKQRIIATRIFHECSCIIALIKRFVDIGVEAHQRETTASSSDSLQLRPFSKWELLIKERIWERILSFMSSSLLHGKTLFPQQVTSLECYYLYYAI